MIQLYKAVYHYFDKLEDRIRGQLSKFPVTYSIIAGTAVVLFWRGVWVVADDFAKFLPANLAWIDGPLSVIISLFVLLITGLFVSFFVSDQVLLSGLKKEKKLIEKTEAEVEGESATLQSVSEKIDHIDKEIEEIKNESKHNNNPQ